MLRHIATSKAADPTKAVVKLVVGEAWDDGSGYQILLDATAKLCDDIDTYEGLDQENPRSYYDQASVTIPADASPSNEETFVTDFESDSAVINGGVYDVLVVNPTPMGDKIYLYIASGNAVLDDFTFENGYTYTFNVTTESSLVMPYDITVEHVVVPMINCEIGEEAEVKLTVKNSGSLDIDSYTVWYTLDGEDSVKQQITEPLKAGKETVVTFTQKITEVKVDEPYEVEAGVIPVAKEYFTHDNYAHGLFVKKDVVTELPLNVVWENYDMVPANPEAWDIYEGEGIEAAIPGEPLVSRCLSLKKDVHYRISYTYMAGGVYLVWAIPESYYVVFGPTSKPMAEWDTVFFDDEAYVEDWTEADINITVDADGEYAFYFQCDVGVFAMTELTFGEVAEKDIRLGAFSTDVPHLVPANHINGAFLASATVQNRGYATIETAEISVKIGQTEVGKVELKNLAADSIHTANINLTVSGLKADDKVTMTATAVLNGELEDQKSDNTYEKSIEVTETEMAYDYADETMYTEEYRIGGNGISIATGIPFTLTVKDTLTAVSLGWAPADADQTIGIRIHKWNKENETLGDLVYETSARRGTTAGQREYKVPSIILEAGSYMISAVQLTTSFYGLIADFTKEGFMYITSNNPVNMQQGLGTPAIRAIFGHDGKPMAKDVFVSEITKPKETGLFAVNQEVVAQIGNNGFESVKAPISLMVNGIVVDTKEVNLSAYESTEVSFTADLSAPSTEYALKVFSTLEDDADVTNDTCEKTVTSLKPANPYIMDFEYCEDYVIEHFNPAWKTVDVDGSITYGFSGISFPHAGEPFAFIVLNPGDLGLDVEAHGGNRIGAAFAAQDGLNDDWLISPKLKMIEGKESMSFFVKTFDDEYGLEKYNVLVSTTNDQPASFTKIGETREAPVEDWVKVTIDLKEYSGKEVYLAIQCVSEDAFIFMIDDITVCEGYVGNENAPAVASLLSLYPNPVNEMVNIHAADVTIEQVSIFNTTGMMVQQFNGLNTTDFRYNVSSLTSGLYFARVATEQGVAVLKFMVR
ncbi:MAG: choice-of-anchor J domain-containing protein [Bacteroides sp.]|nr:choice-of-anchor J domain-containing protein [Bacteroides sp.]MCM1084812.1 choice-of-anchor J domain-containing protein [Bacteroides sp.]